MKILFGGPLTIQIEQNSNSAGSYAMCNVLPNPNKHTIPH